MTQIIFTLRSEFHSGHSSSNTESQVDTTTVIQSSEQLYFFLELEKRFVPPLSSGEEWGLEKYTATTSVSSYINQKLMKFLIWGTKCLWRSKKSSCFQLTSDLDEWESSLRYCTNCCFEKREEIFTLKKTRSVYQIILYIKVQLHTSIVLIILAKLSFRFRFIILHWLNFF